MMKSQCPIVKSSAHTEATESGSRSGVATNAGAAGGGRRALRTAGGGRRALRTAGGGRLAAGGAGRGGRPGDDAVPGIAEDVELGVGEVLQEERADAGQMRGPGGR